MNVMHIVHWPKSGITKLVCDISFSLRRYGVKSNLLMFKESPDYEKELRLKFDSVDSREVSSFARQVMFVADRIKYYSPDIIHTHSFSPFMSVNMQLHKVRHVTTIHNNYPYFHDNHLKSIFKRSLLFKLINARNTTTIPVSTAIGTILADKGVYKDNINVILNGVAINSSQKSEEFNSADSRIKLITVGRLHEQKGYPYLIDAVDILRNNNYDIELTIVGDGPERGHLEDIIRKKKLTGIVKLAGYSDDPQSYLMNSHIFISSSIYEGLSLAIAEAMAIGLPVIATRTSGSEDIITDKEDGLIIETKNVSQLVESVKLLISDDKLRSSISIKARAKIANKFDIEKVVDKYYQLYTSLVSRH